MTKTALPNQNPVILPGNSRTTSQSTAAPIFHGLNVNWWMASMPPKPFCLFVCNLVLILLACVALMNWAIDPFGQYSTKLFRTVIHNTRSEKYALFEALKEQPDGLILGSSRTMKFEPKYLQERTSLSFFNYSVNHGRTEDYLAILRAYRDRYGCSPKVVLMGVDIASLNDVVPYDAQPSAEPNLYRFVQSDLPWKDNFNRFCQLFSYQQFTSSIQSLRNATATTPRTREEEFESDGLLQYLRRQAEVASGTYDFESALDYNVREYQSLYGNLKQLSAHRLAFLFEAVRLCEQNGCQVILFSTVHHPRLRTALEAKTPFVKLEKEAIQTLSRLSDNLHANFVDFGRIEEFQGSETEFFDGIHPTESNTRLMIDRMLPTLNEALYAIH